MKPANTKARALLRKLEALAERGIDGEKIAAQHKLARLKARFNFSTPDPPQMPDLFSGRFTPARKATRVYTFEIREFDIANCVKWAIESAASIPCSYQNGHLMAEATSSTAKKLADIAAHITYSFRALITQFGSANGVTASDRTVFVMGLYDGMMNEPREVGQRLPSRAGTVKRRSKTKKTAVTHVPGLNIHPYTVALSLGRQIRFSVPLAQITAELETVMQKQITSVKP